MSILPFREHTIGSAYPITAHMITHIYPFVIILVV